MARRELKHKAIELRKEGKTYGDIKQILNIQKSTLSGWLSNYPLTKKQIKKIEVSKHGKRLVAIGKTTLIKLAKRQKCLQKNISTGKQKTTAFNKERALFMWSVPVSRRRCKELTKWSKFK